MVTFEYTDGRLRDGYEIEIGAARVHEMLTAGKPIRIVAGQDVYDEWCKTFEVEPYVAPVEPDPEPAPPEQYEAPEGEKDGWPDGTVWTRRGAWYSGTVEDGQDFKEKGKAAAQEAARKLAGGA